MRLFFALFPPQTVRSALADLQKELRNAVNSSGVRWTQANQFHFTVRFLGEVAELQVPKLITAATQICANHPSFLTAIGDLALLPQGRRPSPQGRRPSPPSDRPHTLVLGVRTGQNEMTTLAQAIEKALQELNLGIPPEKRPFHAHLTLARIKDAHGAKAVQTLLQYHWQKLDQIPAFMVESCTLVQSELRPEGPIYTSLAECPLRHVPESE